MNIKQNILLRIYITFILFAVLGLAILLQILQIQVVEGKYWRSLADSLTTSFVTIEPIRGNIYSADGKLMVTSLPIYDVRIDFKTEAWQDPSIYKTKIDSLAWKLAWYFKDKSPQQYKKLLQRARRDGERYYLLKRSLNHHQLNAVKKFPLLNMGRFKSGMVVVEGSKRIYPFNELAKRTIGYKVENIQGVGLEGAYNNFLCGQTGKRLMQKISGGKWIPINYDNEIDPEDGKDIITTIDLNIQDITENALLKTLIKNNADNGCAVVMETNTGHIKAIANLTIDSFGNYIENFNYAVGNAVEPGSTIKLATAIVLLENNIVSLNDLIETNRGKFKYYDKVMKDSDTGEYDKITFQEAFERSSNVAFSRLVFENYRKRPQTYINELKKLRLLTTLTCRYPARENLLSLSPETSTGAASHSPGWLWVIHWK
jgi:cell division protein FtsI (penicillin-binding protein 3)